MTDIERCPTCGGTGPDRIDRVGDYGGDVFEAACGDEWHDSNVSLRWQLEGAVALLEEVRSRGRRPFGGGAPYDLAVRIERFLDDGVYEPHPAAKGGSRR